MISMVTDLSLQKSNVNSNTTLRVFDAQPVSGVVSIDGNVGSTEFVDSNRLEASVIDSVIASELNRATFVVVVKVFSVPVSPIRL